MAAGRLDLGNGNAGCHVCLRWELFGWTFALSSKHTKRAITPMTTFGYWDLSKLCFSVLSLPLNEQPRVSSTQFPHVTSSMFMVQKACSYECSILFPNTSESCNGSLHWQSQVVTISIEGVSYCGHQSPNPDCRFIIFTSACISHKENLHLFSGSWLSCRHWWLGQPWFDLCL